MSSHDETPRIEPIRATAIILNAALGEDTLVLERTIDVHVRSLRKKMDAHADLIETVRGVGYKFRDPADVR